MINKKEIPFITLTNNERLRLGEVKVEINGELTLQRFNFGISVANRTSIINHLIKKNNFRNYLEIGVRDLRNFEKINIENKIGVDPHPLKTNNNILRIDSDNFFLENKKKFDIIFIDGLHLEYQVDNDLKNSLKFLSDNGYIVMHDCNPPSEFHQREVYEVDGKFPSWNGTTWKSYAKLRINNQNLTMSCVNCDWGVGIINRGFQNKYKTVKKIDYSLLEDNRLKLLNLISVKEFIESY